MQIQYRVSYGFVSLPYTAVGDFTDTIINGMTGNAGFPTPPVAMTLLETQKQDYLTKLAATAQGGTLATAQKNDAWDVLIGSLRQLAGYVQSEASKDVTLLLSSGFQPISTNRAQSPLPQPVVLNVDNSVPAQLNLRLQPVANARAYEVQTKSGTGDWQSAGLFTKARSIILDGLTAGTVYTYQVRAIGGSTGWSVWSVPGSKIST